MFKLFKSSALLLLVLVIFQPFVQADDQDQALQLRKRGDILPLEALLQKAQKIHPGKILEVELKKKHQRYIYELEILGGNGIVWELSFDAHTGKLLKSKRED